MKTISTALFGAPLDPFSHQTRQHIALVAFLAWIGLGRRRLVLVLLRSGGSVSCARRAYPSRPLHGGRHRADGLCHRRRLQPGGRAFPLRGRRLQGRDQSDRSLYRVGLRRRTYRRLHADHRDLCRERRRRGFQSAAGCRAEPKAVDRSWRSSLLLLYLNLRGMRESIQVLLPIFLGFFVTHVLLILYGIAMQCRRPARADPGDGCRKPAS